LAQVPFVAYVLSIYHKTGLCVVYINCNDGETFKDRDCFPRARRSCSRQRMYRRGRRWLRGEERWWRSFADEKQGNARPGDRTRRRGLEHARGLEIRASRRRRRRRRRCSDNAGSFVNFEQANTTGAGLRLQRVCGRLYCGSYMLQVQPKNWRGLFSYYVPNR